MNNSKINQINTGQNIYKFAGKKKTPGESMMNITDSFIATGEKSEQGELDLRKVSEILTRKSGSTEWPLEPLLLYEPESNSKQPPVSAPDGKLYIADGNRIMAFDEKSGKVAGKFEIPSKVKSFAITGKGYLVAADDDFVYGFDKKTGKVNWKEQKRSFGKPVVNSRKSMTANSGFTVFVADYDYGVYAINARTGKTRWSNPTICRISESPALSPDGSTLFASDPTSELYIIDTKKGDKHWQGRTSLPTGDVKYTALPGGNFIYGYEKFYSVKTIDGKTRKIKWNYDLNKGLSGPPVADEKNGTVFLAEKTGAIISLDMNGKVRWKEYLEEEKDNVKMAVGTDGTLFVGGKSDSIQALDGKTGNLKWNFKIAGELSLEPVACRNDVFYVKGESGKVYSFPLNMTEALKKDKVSRPGKATGEKDPVIKHGETFIEIGGVKLPVMNPEKKA